MSFQEPPYLANLRRLEEQERLMRQHLAMLHGPFEQVRRMEEAARQYFKFEQLAKVSSAATFMPGLSSTLAAATAFEALYQQSQRVFNVQSDLLRSFERSQLLYQRVATAALNTSRLSEVVRLADHSRLFGDLQSRLSQLTAAGAAVYDTYSRDASLMARASDWQLQAPSILPFSASTTVALLSSSQLPPDGETAGITEVLDQVGSRVESQLNGVSVALVEPYRGAISALATAGPDWPRHVGSSLRVLVDELLLALAPDDELRAFFADPSQHIEDGQFTRRARLTYVFRDVAHGTYARMVENDIDMALATFFPSNAAVHSLLPTLDERQARVFLRRVQGCLGTILATVEQ